MVSVIIPTYNRSELIIRAAKSVLQQTYKDLELIIVDDGSTDNTEQAVNILNDSRVRYIKQVNQGACVARNNGINHAKGEYIAFHDSDDIWHPQKLEKQISILQQTKADLVFCCMDNIENERKIGVIGDNFPEGFITDSMLILGASTQTLCAHAYVFKDEQFDKNIPRLQDFELLLRIQKKYKIYYMKESLVDYYIQKDSISLNPEKLLQAWTRIIEKNRDFCIVYKQYLEKPALHVLTAASQSSNKKQKKELIKLAFSMNKSLKLYIKYLLIQNDYLYQKIAYLHKKIKGNF